MPSLAQIHNPNTTTTTLRLLALSGATVLLPLVGAVLPRDADVLWLWVWVGAGASLVVAFIGVRQVHSIVANSKSLGSSAAALILLNALLYVAAGSFAYGLSATFGLYRIMFIGPLLIMAAYGTRTMLAMSYVACMTTLGLITAGSDFPPQVASAGVAPSVLSVLPAFLISYGAGFLLAALFVRELAQSANRSINLSERFAELASVAARAETADDGLEEMMPVVGSYLSATFVAIYSVSCHRLSEDPIATWSSPTPKRVSKNHPTGATKASDEHIADLRIAARDSRPVVRDGWACMPVSTPDGVAMAVLATTTGKEVLNQVAFDFAVDAVSVQVGVLLTRLDLIDRLEALTRTDTLTNLPNRRSLTERMEHDLAVSSRSSLPISVVMFDLDHFKRYNDSFGHVAGDELLRSVALMLRTRLRASDFVARYGGEEFCAVLTGTSPHQALVVVNELHRRCRELPALRTVTFSAGVAEYDGKESIGELIDRADKALYEAKAAGRDRTIVAPTGKAPDPEPDAGSPTIALSA